MIFLSFAVLNDMIKVCKDQPQERDHIQMYAMYSEQGVHSKIYIEEAFNFALNPKNNLIERVFVKGKEMYQAVPKWS